MLDNYQQAEELASRGYQVRFKTTEAPSGEIGYAAFLVEIPACIAYGLTEQEAANALDGLKVDFIESLLDRDLPVPIPSIRSSYGLGTHVLADDEAYTQSGATPLVLQMAV